MRIRALTPVNNLIENLDLADGRAAGAPKAASRFQSHACAALDVHVAVGGWTPDAGALSAYLIVEPIQLTRWHLGVGARNGFMRAASRGALGAGGDTIGFLPGADGSVATEYVRIPIATGLGVMRKSRRRHGR